MKSIRAIKSIIHEVRGDFDKYDEIHPCSQHSNCTIYRKPKSSKNIHRRISSNDSTRKYLKDAGLYDNNDIMSCPACKGDSTMFDGYWMCTDNDCRVGRFFTA